MTNTPRSLTVGTIQGQNTWSHRQQTKLVVSGQGMEKYASKGTNTAGIAGLSRHLPPEQLPNHCEVVNFITGLHDTNTTTS